MNEDLETLYAPLSSGKNVATMCSLIANACKEDTKADCLAVLIARYMERNLLFSGLTAREVEKKHALGQRTRTTEVGSGTGVNCFAAKLAGAEDVIGYEINNDAYDFSCRMRDHLGIDVSFRHANAFEVAHEKPIDIFVSENLSDVLFLEPQLALARAFQAYTHETTAYVPLGARFYTDRMVGEVKFDTVPEEVVFPCPHPPAIEGSQYSVRGVMLCPEGKEICLDSFRGVNLSGFLTPEKRGRTWVIPIKENPCTIPIFSF